jgi:hypothetical protein
MIRRIDAQGIAMLTITVAMLLQFLCRFASCSPEALVCETNVQSYALPLMQALLG